MVVQLTAVLEGEDLDPDRFLRFIRNALDEEVEEIDKLYHLFYDTWDGDKPSMVKEVIIRGGDAYGEVSTRGRTGEKGNLKLLWLDEGTQVRWSMVSIPDWQSKTKVGSIRSGRGGGRIIARGKAKTFHARRGKRGITARNVSENIANERRMPFQLNIDDAIERAAK